MSTRTFYRLMVSYDCGMHYHEEAAADNPSEFLDTCKRLDAEYLRWYIEDPQGGMCHDLPCMIHARILGFMEAVTKGQ